MNFGTILSTENYSYANVNINTSNVNPDDVTIIFNFSDSRVERFIPFNELKNYANRVIYNFPNASYIKIENTNIYGTILAPSADIIINNGEIKGQIIGKSLSVTWPNMNEVAIFDGKVKNNNGDSISIIKLIDISQDSDNEVDDGDTNDVEEVPDDHDDDDEAVEDGDDEDDDDDNEAVEDGDDEGEENGDNDDNNDDIPKENPIPHNLDGSTCKTSSNPLGVISSFGVFSFNDFKAYNSDVQGRVAAKNILEVTSYSINEAVYGGNRYRCDESPLKEDFPFAVVAGTVKISNSGVGNGGIAYIDNADYLDSELKKNIMSNGCSVIKDAYLDFDFIEKNVNILSKQLATLNDNGVVCIFFF